ncbi:MAG: hypothetical protein F4Y07_09990 [Gemmatimonadetes bacterium]|nr:hypothetical protein [Gemmatimonadota bacterium]MYE16794.1 hypothetical protein [Gemmatimonadota bacterium]
MVLSTASQQALDLNGALEDRLVEFDVAVGECPSATGAGVVGRIPCRVQHFEVDDGASGGLFDITAGSRRSNPSISMSARISWRLASDRSTSRSVLSIVSPMDEVPSRIRTRAISSSSITTLVFLTRLLRFAVVVYLCSIVAYIHLWHAGVSWQDRCGTATRRG